jgi:excisionase family DNA binding protein
MTQEENNLPIFNYIDKKFDELKKFYQPKEPTKFLTRQEVAEMLSVDLSTVHNMTKKGVLQKYQISGRVLYKRAEVENAIVKLNK